MKLLGLFKGATLLLSKRKSAILCGVAIASTIGTAITAVRATIKASKDIEEAKDEKYERVNADREDSDDIPRDEIKLTPLEYVKVTWKHYLPVAICVVVNGVSIICAHKIDAKRIAAATSALMLSEKMNKELEDKTIEEFGKEKLDQIKEKIFGENKDLKKAYVDDKKALHRDVLRHDTCNTGYYKPSTSDRMCWFKDPLTGRYFWASKNQVEKGINAAMRQAVSNGSLIISLNDFYDYLDLEQIDDGYSRGWDLQRGQELNVTYEPDITDNGEPCLIMRYHSKPIMI